jgi:hypothetical protein
LTKRSKSEEDETEKERAMRNPSENKIVKYNSWFLGTVIFLFGFLKFFDPFRTWFHIQIAKSGLPPLAVPLGMAGEMSIGLSLLLVSAFRQRIKGLCPSAGRCAGECSSLGHQAAVHPAGLHAAGRTESLSTPANQGECSIR